MSAREKTWDGRGDKLTDARMSWIAGRAADDLRLSEMHLRLLAHLGRQNHRRGWLRLSQQELAEQWQGSRTRLNGVIKDLVEWGYVMKRSQAQTGESFCTYKVRLDDPEDAAGECLAEETPPRQKRARGECLAPETPGVSRPGDTSVSPRDTPVSRPGDTPHYIPARAPTTPTIAKLNTPPPTSSRPAAARRGGGKDWIEELREEGHPPVVLDELLQRLVDAGLSTWKAADGQPPIDPTGPGRQICLDLKADTVEVVEAVREAILGRAKYRLPPVAEIRELAERARAAAEERLNERSALSDLPGVGVLEPETTRLLDAIRRLKPSAGYHAAWHTPIGVVSVAGSKVVVVTPNRPSLVEMHGSSFVVAAARAIWGAAVEVDFVQGRAVARAAA